MHAHPHTHGDYIHTHPHGHSPEAHPHRNDRTPLALLDRLFGRIGLYQQLRPLIIGIVHGLAGSAAVALLVLTTIRDPRWAVAYLLVFGMGTVAGMMLITMSIASAFNFFGSKNKSFPRVLGLASGLLSLAFGDFPGLSDRFWQWPVHRTSAMDATASAGLSINDAASGCRFR